VNTSSFDYGQAHDLRGSLLLIPQMPQKLHHPQQGQPSIQPTNCSNRRAEQTTDLKSVFQIYPSREHAAELQSSGKEGKKANIFPELGEGRSLESISDGLIGPVQHSIQPDYYPRSLDLGTLTI